jgi:hypothetical protein
MICHKQKAWTPQTNPQTNPHKKTIEVPLPQKPQAEVVHHPQYVRHLVADKKLVIQHPNSVTQSSAKNI